MKKFIYALTLTLSVGCLYGCAGTVEKRPSGPLPTGAQMEPPAGCVALRAQGGAC